MPISVLIDCGDGRGPADYAPYLEPSSLQINDGINVPTSVDFSLVPTDSSFVVPVRSAYVQVYSSKYNVYLATGFIVNTPTAEFLGMGRGGLNTKFQQYRYRIQVTSDEYLLNSKALPFIPAFVNQGTGQILGALAQALVPEYYDVTSYCASGDLVPYFQYDPFKSWSDLAKEFADSGRYHYKVINRVIYFQPYGDQLLGVKYDDELGEKTFDGRGLQTQVQSIPLVNDAIVIGDVEPQNSRDDYFIGDGLSGIFPLRHVVFEGETALLLQDDWTEDTISTSQWLLTDPTAAINLFGGSLDVIGGLGLGQTYLLARNGIEMGGQTYVQHGEVVFDDASTGIIGGLYSDVTALIPGNCVAGFNVSGSVVTVTASGAAGVKIQPMLNGALVGTEVTTIANHHYLLQTLINADEFSRWNQTYRTMAGNPFGGAQRTSLGKITWLITDIDVANPSNPTVTRYTANNVSMPPFTFYGLINASGMNLHLNYTQIAFPPQGSLIVASLYGPTGTQLPSFSGGTNQSYPLGFGLQNQVATIAKSSGDVDSLQFYIDTIPAVGARIRLQTWDAGTAIGRMRDDISIATEAAIVGDDGVRSAILTGLKPAPRTSEDCEVAAAAALLDRVPTRYQGSYAFNSYYLDRSVPRSGTTDLSIIDVPRPGRYLYCNAPQRGITRQNFLISGVGIRVIELKEDIMELSISFGPDSYLERILAPFVKRQEAILTPDDIAIPPLAQTIAELGTSFLPDASAAVVTAINGTSITVDLGVPPITGAEIRDRDFGWGFSDVGLLATKSTQIFTLPRTQYEQTWYIRFVNGIKTSRFSKALRVVYPQIPSAPTGTVDGGNPIGPVIKLDFAGDIRNIAVVEVRASDNATVLFQRRVLSAADLIFQRQGLQSSLTFYCYFANLMWEYSLAYIPTIINSSQSPFTTNPSGGLVVDIATGAAGKAVELVRNPTFESGDRDWTKGAGFSIVSDGNAYNGSYAAKFSASSGVAAIENAISITVKEGQKLYATCMIKRTAGSGLGYVRISWRDSSGSELATTSGTSITTGAYSPSEVVGIAPASSVFAVVEGVGDANSSATVAYFDQFDAVRFYSNLYLAYGTTLAPTTTSSSFADIPEMSVDIPTHGGNVLMLFQMSHYMNAPGQSFFRVVRDGAELNTGFRATTQIVSTIGMVVIAFVDTGLAAGVHTYKAQWAQVAGGTLNAYDEFRTIQVVEI